jgi:hypothetical protein
MCWRRKPRHAPIIGRLVDRGLDDELKGTAYAVVDGVDGRTHHIKLPDLDAAGDSAPGSIVELRKFDDAQGSAVSRSPSAPISTSRAGHGEPARPGSTGRISPASPFALSEGGFGAEVRQAMDRRAAHLVGTGSRERTHGQRVTFTRNLIDTLRRREVEALGEKLAAETGRPFNRAGQRRVCRRHLSPALRARLRPLRHDRRRPRLPARALVARPSKSSSVGTSPASPAATAASTGASAATAASVSGKRCRLTQALAMPGLSDIDFDPPRVEIAPRGVDLS